ncbi:MAG: CPBP family intramembrane metalloprotease [Lachnospiraceae bacterium]|nr:CPBP family intramembrane metalloprotease [Lachnospiraceae bacterium]
MERMKLKPWHGIVSFVVMMVVFLIAAIPIQSKLGLIGVAITELLLLAMAIGAALIFKQDLKEVFPIRVPKLREVFGVLLFCAGGFIVSILVATSMALVFPGMLEVSQEVSGIVTSEGMWLGILIASVMPAICEEAVHRGFILHTFKDVKKQWVIVLSMAIIFGVFHTDVYRFVPTAILGACMTWVMLKTKNMLMPALYHATNNLVPVLMGMASKGLSQAVTTPDGTSVTTVSAISEMEGVMVLSSIGVYLMLVVVAFPLMLAGTALMKKKDEKIAGKHVAAVFVITGVLFFVGLAIVIGTTAYIMATQGVGM